MSDIVLDTPQAIHMWVFLSREKQLALEIATGMTHSRGSILQDVKRQGWTSKNTKKGALLDLFTIHRAIDPEWSPSERLAEGLDPKKVAKALRDGDRKRGEFVTGE